MTAEELTRRYPNASVGFIKANCEDWARIGSVIEGQQNDYRSLQASPQPKPIIRDESLGQAEGKEGNAKGVYVRVISFRTRLTDPDNLCPKYFIDCLRYAQIIPNDTTEDIELAVIQRKVATRKEERTEIMIGEL